MALTQIDNAFSDSLTDIQGHHLIFCIYDTLMRLKRLTLLSYNNSKEVILMCIHRCFFVEHRDAPSSLYEQLKAEIRRLIISENVQEFVIGSYGSFDALASSAAVRLKSEFPDIRILRLLPYYHPSCTIFLPDGFDICIKKGTEGENTYHSPIGLFICCSRFYNPRLDTNPFRAYNRLNPTE